MWAILIITHHFLAIIDSSARLEEKRMINKTRASLNKSQLHVLNKGVNFIIWKLHVLNFRYPGLAGDLPSLLASSSET